MYPDTTNAVKSLTDKSSHDATLGQKREESREAVANSTNKDYPEFAHVTEPLSESATSVQASIHRKIAKEYTSDMLGAYQRTHITLEGLRVGFLTALIVHNIRSWFRPIIT